MLPLAATLAAGERPGKPGAEKQARPKADLKINLNLSRDIFNQLRV
jgi:hypothetical protein